MTRIGYNLPRDLLRRMAARAEAEGRAEGRLAGMTGALFHVLKARGVEISGETRDTIRSCKDAAQIYRWVRRAATADRVEDLGGPLARRPRSMM
ncbi:hypothetical protein [Actinoplanes sp. CA-252034]|uniref:hypothetical protein n=1 Tax=Actinoplanes sp. CA-252034 TaxID=3239906 RepID=UPI003D95F694